MAEEINEEILSILQKMAERLEDLEKIVFNEENILMKSGLVVTKTPTPTVALGSGLPDRNEIHKMKWDELDKLAKRMTG
jgi:hypothetical protein